MVLVMEDGAKAYSMTKKVLNSTESMRDEWCLSREGEPKLLVLKEKDQKQKSENENRDQLPRNRRRGGSPFNDAGSAKLNGGRVVACAWWLLLGRGGGRGAGCASSKVKADPNSL